MQSAALRDLPAKQSLKKGPTLEKEPPGQLALSDASDHRIAGPPILARLEKALAGPLEDTGGLHFAGTILGASPAQKTAGKDFFKAL